LSERYPTFRSNLAFGPPRLWDTFSMWPVSLSAAMIARSALGTVIASTASPMDAYAFVSNLRINDRISGARVASIAVRYV
jgi:hypothetical protein